MGPVALSRSLLQAAGGQFCAAPLSIVHQKDIHLPAPTFCDKASLGSVDPSPSVSWAAGCLSPTLAPPHPPHREWVSPGAGCSVRGGVYTAGIPGALTGCGRGTQSASPGMGQGESRPARGSPGVPFCWLLWLGGRKKEVRC